MAVTTVKVDMPEDESAWFVSVTKEVNMGALDGKWRDETVKRLIRMYEYKDQELCNEREALRSYHRKDTNRNVEYKSAEGATLSGPCDCPAVCTYVCRCNLCKATKDPVQAAPEPICRYCSTPGVMRYPTSGASESFWTCEAHKLVNRKTDES